MNLSVPRLLEALGIEAKKRGKRWHSRCPAHEDHKPSWAIFDDPGERGHGRHKCMSCGFRGDAVDLAREALGLASKSVAKEWVEQNARDGGAEIPTAVKLNVVEATSKPFAYPPGVREIPDPPTGNLGDGNALGRALAYLSERSIGRDQIRRWRLAYATDGRLAWRIVIPTHDASGRLISYTARTFTSNPVRYKMPRLDERAEPGAIFGERYWPEPRARRILLLAEGAINALAVERALAGYGWLIGAVGGSELQAEQVLKLATWPIVVLAQDGDAAGKKLGKALRAILASTSEVRIAKMPPGKDAADVEREGGLGALLAPLTLHAGAEGATAG